MYLLYPRFFHTMVYQMNQTAVIYSRRNSLFSLDIFILVFSTKNSSGIFTEQENIEPLTRLSLHSYSLDTSGFCIIDNIQWRIFDKTNYIHKK